MTAMAPGIVRGSVMHRRLRPARNQFVYSTFSLALPLSRLAELPGLGVAWNRRGLISFFDRDHGERDGSALEPWIRKLLASEDVSADGEVVLHVFPRVLGYVFNPVSFWVCHDREGGVRAVLCEVCNTFGEQHNYLLAHRDGRPLRSGESAPHTATRPPPLGVSGIWTSSTEVKNEEQPEANRRLGHPGNGGCLVSCRMRRQHGFAR